MLNAIIQTVKTGLQAGKTVLQAGKPIFSSGGGLKGILEALKGAGYGMKTAFQALPPAQKGALIKTAAGAGGLVALNGMRKA